MKTLAEYEAELPPAPMPEKSGIECPDCKEELEWWFESLLLKNPPMRRINCKCGFSKVIRYAPAKPE